MGIKRNVDYQAMFEDELEKIGITGIDMPSDSVEQKQEVKEESINFTTSEKNFFSFLRKLKNLFSKKEK